MYTVKRVLVFAAFLLITMKNSNQSNMRLKEIFNWNQIDFVFESEAKRQSMIETGQFIPGNSIPTAIGIWGDRLFLALPRFKLGVPATLAYIDTNGTDEVENVSSPALTPYPNLESHELQSRNITSIQNIQVDTCDRLWAIDSGQIEGKQETTPTLYIYDLKTNLQTESYKLKSKTEYKTESYLADIMIDVTSSNCENAFAYIPDANNYEIIIYNLKTQDSYKVGHNYFHFDPLYGDLKIDDTHYQTQHGIFGLAMSPVGRDDFRTLYFSSLASTMEFAITTKALQNKTLDGVRSFYEFKVMGSRGPDSHSSASALDEETGVLFYTLISKNSIGCWNSFSGEEYTDKTQGIVAEDETLIYPSDVITDKNGILWTITNRQPRFLLSTLNSKEINFRIFFGTIRNIIKGTVCDTM